MSLIEPLLLGLVLSADSFSASIAMGLKPHKLSDAFKFASLSGSAELIAVFAGAMAGEKMVAQFGSSDHWIAFVLLVAVAVHMLYEGFIEWKSKKTNSQPAKFHGFFKLAIVSIATSLDALAVGVGLGVSNKPLWPYLISTGGWAFVSTLVGMGIANKIPQRLSALFNVIGAMILLIIAVQIITDRL